MNLASSLRMSRMRINSPVGEYEYRVTGARFDHGRVEIAGSLGQWETTVVIEPSDWLALGRRVAPVLGAAAGVLAAVRLARRGG
jgi:hypothetical protein